MSKKSGGSGGSSSSSGGGFQSMNLSPPIFAGVKKLGYRTPTPVQRKSLPILLTGSDAVVMARTGSELISFVCVCQFNLQSCSFGVIWYAHFFSVIEGDNMIA